MVVCTRDRSEQLAGCLRALAAQDYDTYEVIVVDNASADERTARVCADFAVRCVREPRPGLSRARNCGIRHARYDIIAFTDDDTMPDPGWLSSLMRALLDPAVAAVTGRVEAADLSTEAARYFETAAGGMSKGSQPREFQRDTMRASDLVAVQAVGVGANMAFRRSVLAVVGEFDERLGAGTPARGADDLEMFHRILAAGLRLRYEPAARVLHRHRSDLAGLRDQLFDTGCGFGVYLLGLAGHGGSDRREALRYAAGKWLPWLVGRVLKGVFGMHPLPSSLLRAQLAGALHAPTAYRAIQREKR